MTDSFMGRIPVPILLGITMFFWGAADRIIPPEQGRELARLVPGALYREAPECGHLPQKECPEALMKALGEFVKFGGM